MKFKRRIIEIKKKIGKILNKGSYKIKIEKRIK